MRVIVVESSGERCAARRLPLVVLRAHIHARPPLRARLLRSEGALAERERGADSQPVRRGNSFGGTGSSSLAAFAGLSSSASAPHLGLGDNIDAIHDARVHRALCFMFSRGERRPFSLMVRFLVS